MSKGTTANATIVGRLGKDPVIRQAGGRDMASLSLGVTSGYGDKAMTSWFDVVVFNEKKVEVLQKYCAKGSRILVHGELRVRKWQDKNGNDRWSTECVVGFDGYIELLDSKDDAPKREGGPTAEDRRNPADDDLLDDDVPF